MINSGVGVRQQVVTDVYTDLQGMQQLGQEKDEEVALKKVAQQFESMFVQMMLKNMRQANAVFEKDSLMNSEETKFYRDMYDDQLSLTLSHGRGIGIADAMYKQMTRQFGIPESTAAEQSLNDNMRTSNSRPSRNTSLKNDINTSINTSHISAFENNTMENKAIENTSADNKSTGNKSTDNKVSSIVDDISRVMLAKSPQEFIERLKPLAEKAAKALGIDENMLLAQSALETGWGSKVIANHNGESSNNLFNIKQGQGWNGAIAQRDTLEIDNGVAKIEKANFRSYDSLAESFNDYVRFIKENNRYTSALENAQTPESYIEHIHAAGYATDPNYADKVKSVYDRIIRIRDEETSAPSTSVQDLYNKNIKSYTDYSG